MLRESLRLHESHQGAQQTHPINRVQTLLLITLLRVYTILLCQHRMKIIITVFSAYKLYNNNDKKRKSRSFTSSVVLSTFYEVVG